MEMSAGKGCGEKEMEGSLEIGDVGELIGMCCNLNCDKLVM